MNIDKAIKLLEDLKVNGTRDIIISHWDMSAFDDLELCEEDWPEIVNRVMAADWSRINNEVYNMVEESNI